jgi:hypothetical protein
MNIRDRWINGMATFTDNKDQIKKRIFAFENNFRQNKTENWLTNWKLLSP